MHSDGKPESLKVACFISASIFKKKSAGNWAIFDKISLRLDDKVRYCNSYTFTSCFKSLKIAWSLAK